MRDIKEWNPELLPRLYPGYAAYVLTFINSAIRDGKRVLKQEKKLKQFLSGKIDIILKADGFYRSVILGLLLFRISPDLYRVFYSWYGRMFRRAGIVR